jgi:hypothetical protein
MEKGISPVISAMLVTLIAISFTIVVMVWLPNFTYGVTSNTGLNSSFDRSRGCLSIEDVNATARNVTLRNCGQIPLSNFSLYIDGQLAGQVNSIIDPGQAVKFSGISIASGNHEFYATSDNAESAPQRLTVP